MKKFYYEELKIDEKRKSFFQDKQFIFTQRKEIYILSLYIKINYLSRKKRISFFINFLIFHIYIYTANENFPPII